MIRCNLSYVATFNFSLNSTRKGSCFEDASFLRVLAYVIVLLVSLVGNSITIAVVIRGRLSRKNVHLFLVNMAVADLVVTVVYMPRMVVMMLYGVSWLITGTFGLILCRAVPFLHHLAIMVSVFTILGATFDRFCAMVFPLRKIMTRCAGKAVVVNIWLLSAAFRSPYLITSVLKHRGHTVWCNSNFGQLFGEHVQMYYNFLLAVYCASLVTTILLYSITILKLKRRNASGHCNEAAQAKREQASKKLLNMLIVILVCFICCWFVYFFAFSIFSRPLSCEVRFFRNFLAHSNSALNPCILAVFNVRYRNGYKTILRKLVSCFKFKDNTYAVS